jgi:hypothetical protein
MRIRFFHSCAFSTFFAFSASAQEQTADEARPFSSFEYGQVISTGVSLDYFHYNEEVDLGDDIASFREHFQREPEIKGAPKSTEYGTDVGIGASGAFYSWRTRLFFRPRAELVLGIGNTYDGSTQGEPIVASPGDTSGLQFFSITGKKNNFLVFAGGDFGYNLPFFRFPLVAYLGIDFMWWYRDLIFTQGGTYYFGNASNVETYTRFALPVGILCVKPVSPDRALGCDVRMDWMFYGTMKETVNTGSSDSTAVFPAVTLGNRPSVKIELFMQKKMNGAAAVKFSLYFVYYGFGKSNTETATTTVSSSGTVYQQVFLEPSSKTFRLGGSLCLDFLKKRFR